MANDLVQVQKLIYEIRGHKVMLDSDLAALYQVETKVLNRAVKRNVERFPSHFMFQLTRNEFSDLRCQFGTSSWGGSRYLPYVFTEQGVAMLSSVLTSKRAIQINIQIMTTFVKMRQFALENEDLAKRIENIERYLMEQGMELENINKAIDLLMDRTKPAKIGFKVEEK